MGVVAAKVVEEDWNFVRSAQSEIALVVSCTPVFASVMIVILNLILLTIRLQLEVSLADMTFACCMVRFPIVLRHLKSLWVKDKVDALVFDFNQPAQ